MPCVPVLNRKFWSKMGLEYVHDNNFDKDRLNDMYKD